MNKREFENALLLRESGELSESDLRELEKCLKENPDWAQLATENQILQKAGPFSSSILVPELPELNRGRILNSANRSAGKKFSRILSLAALVLMGLGLASHLGDYLKSKPPVVSARITPIRSTLDEEDPILENLSDLESQLSLWSGVQLKDDVILENENDWAEILLSFEEST